MRLRASREAFPFQKEKPGAWNCSRRFVSVAGHNPNAPFGLLRVISNPPPSPSLCTHGQGVFNDAITSSARAVFCLSGVSLKSREEYPDGADWQIA